MDESMNHEQTPQAWDVAYDSSAESVDVDEAETILVLDEAPAALTLDVWEPTGDAIVDGALERLAAIPTSELAEQVEIFGTIHDELRARLSDLSS